MRFRKARKIIIWIFSPILLIAMYIFLNNLYIDYNYNILLEEYIRVMPKAQMFISENAYLLDIIRYSDYTKYNMKMSYTRDYSQNSKSDIWSPCIDFEKDNLDYCILLHSDELHEHLPSDVIETIIHLTETSGSYYGNLTNIYSDGVDKIFSDVTIDGVSVYITCDSYEMTPNYSYVEKAGDYYIQVIAFRLD
jgi:hypothetical protein